MTLADFFSAIAPYLEGHASHDHAARALFSPASDENDVRRLAIYGRFCRIHRLEALEFTYPWCRAVILRTLGADGWERLVESYFRAHPMFHVELNENGAELASFLAGLAGQPEAGLSEWLAELADFEWWEWRTRSAPDSDEDAHPDLGPLRLAATVELRPYRWDFVSWCDGLRDGEPEARSCVVLFWRDRDLDLRREDCSPLELGALKWVAEGLSAATLAEAGIDRKALSATLEDLRAAGVILGTVTDG